MRVFEWCSLSSRDDNLASLEVNARRSRRGSGYRSGETHVVVNDSASPVLYINLYVCELVYRPYRCLHANVTSERISGRGIRTLTLNVQPTRTSVYRDPKTRPPLLTHLPFYRAAPCSLLFTPYMTRHCSSSIDPSPSKTV